MTRHTDTRYGTSNFVSLQAAIDYYKPYGYTADEVVNKLDANEISLGPPTTPATAAVHINEDGRYWVYE